MKISENKIYNPEIECMDRDSIKKIQDKRLIETVAHTYNNVTEPKLPTGTTYTTHYTSSGGRVVTGADGTAWYSPNHYYSSWIQMR